jgi:hypothetical protein
MAVEYAIPIDTTVPLDNIKCSIEEFCGLVEIPPHGRAITLISEGTWCYLMMEDELGRELISERYGFIPTIHARIRMDPFKVELGVQKLVDVVGTLLTALPGNLVVLENDELPLLLRKEGSITIDQRDPYWESRFTSALASRNITFALGRLPPL